MRVSQQQVHALAMAITCLFGVSEANGQSDESFFTQVLTSVKRGDLRETKNAGFDVGAQGRFSEAPQSGGILVGFDVGVGQPFRQESIVALRPIYRTAKGEYTFGEHGRFRDEPRGVNGRPVKSEVTQTVRAVAIDGYAVGAIQLQTGLSIEGMAIVFQRIEGGKLNPDATYVSEWIGKRSAKQVDVLSSNGQLIVGVKGNKDERQIRALGLVYLDRPIVAATTSPPKPGPTKTKTKNPDPKNESAKDNKSKIAKTNEAGSVPEDGAAEQSETASGTAQSSKKKGFRWGTFAVFALFVVPAFLFLFSRMGGNDDPRKEPAKRNRDSFGIDPEAPDFGDSVSNPRTGKRQHVEEEEDARYLDFDDPEPPNFGGGVDETSRPEPKETPTGTAVNRSEAICPKPKSFSSARPRTAAEDNSLDPEPPAFT